MKAESQNRMYQGPVEPTAAQDLTLYAERGTVSQAFVYDMPTPASGLRLNPALEPNPVRERILADAEAAIIAFELIRQGKLAEFVDCVGMQDDGEATRIVVTAENVDTSEAYLRGRLSWLCPELIAGIEYVTRKQG